MQLFKKQSQLLKQETKVEKAIELPPHILERLSNLERYPLIAQVGGFRPKEGVSSYFGGNFLFPPNTDWYHCNNKPLQPVLQILTEELGEYAKVFGSAKLVQVFVYEDISELPFDRAKNGDNWLLLEFDNIDDFVTLPSPKFEYSLKPFSIKWEISKKPDMPTWEDANFILDSEEYDVLPYLSEYYPAQATKIGGYAEYIQYPAFDYENIEYIFQIASEYKANFVIGDTGNIYIGKDVKTDEWVLSWDCL